MYVTTALGTELSDLIHVLLLFLFFFGLTKKNEQSIFTELKTKNVLFYETKKEDFNHAL